MKEGKTILPYDLADGRVVVVLNVPALVCEQCGDEFVEIAVSRNVECIIDRVQRDGMKMGFVEYEKAA
jgi:YgiT-type zinc finger domain-containing protein